MTSLRDFYLPARSNMGQKKFSYAAYYGRSCLYESESEVESTNSIGQLLYTKIIIYHLIFSTLQS